MELTVLGSCGTWPENGGACSGYLLRHDGFSVWVDLGNGTLANLQRHIGILDVDGVIISHSHPDHMADLYPYFFARHYGLGARPGVPLYCPTGFFARAGALLSEETFQQCQSSFRIDEIEPGTAIELGPFRIATAPMAHPVPTLGMRFEAGGAVFAFTADSGPTPAIQRIAREAHVLLAEATWQEDGIRKPPDIHMTAREAAEAATQAGAARLMLTHIWPTLDRERSRSEAAAAFDGEVLLAETGTKLEVGA